MKNCNICKSNNGFALIVIPIVAILVSLFVINIMKPIEVKSFYSEIETKNKMEKVRKSLASYVHKQYRLPCPADISHSTSDDKFGTEQAGCNPKDGDSQQGIVPFKELGLTIADVKDEWGNYFTYSVSPNFTSKMTNADFGKINQLSYADNSFDDGITVAKSGKAYVHKLCRTGGKWIHENADGHYNKDGSKKDFSAGITYNLSKNIFKAQFCCSAGVKGGLGEEWDARDAKDEYNGNTEYAWQVNGEDQVVFNVKSYPEHPNLPASNYNYSSNSDIELKYQDRISHNESYGLGHIGGKIYGDEYIFLDFVNSNKPASVELILGDIGANNIGDDFPYVFVFVNERDGSEFLQVNDYNILEANPDAATDPDSVGSAKFSASRDDHETELLAEIDAWNIANPLEPPMDISEIGISEMVLGLNESTTGHTSFLLKGINITETVTPLDSHDVVMLGQDGEPRLAERNKNEDFKSVNDVLGPLDDVTKSEVSAYALVSHGKNGFGAYYESDVDGDQDINLVKRVKKAGEIIGIKEEENIDGDEEFFDAPPVYSPGEVENYDDIVMWDSQVSLYNALSNGTCTEAQSY